LVRYPLKSKIRIVMTLDADGHSPLAVLVDGPNGTR
jgi:hypothetical protein